MRQLIINTIPAFIIIFIICLFINGCGEDSSVEPIPPAEINIIVKSATDSSVIPAANVVLYNANTGESISRNFSGSDGVAIFEDPPMGNFYVKLSAQGFREIPLGNVSPVPFSISTGQKFYQTYYMDLLPGTFGKIEGTVFPEMGGFLITATSSTTNSDYHTYSGPDGYFVLFNTPFNSYVVNAVKSGYQSANQPEVTVSSSSSSATVQINVNQINGSTLSGRVTFLSIINGTVDITLLDEDSFSAVNGLATIIDTNRNYMLNTIPAGNFLAWASYKNDGYVMDPDWIFKNPGALNVSFENDNSKVLDFSVTGAITIISPTNPAEEIIPVVADSIIPTFHWMAYPQTKEYIIEVRDINGNLLWGGFTETGVINHTQIPKEFTSIEFNFDGTALSNLLSGHIYQWRIYSDDDAALNIQTLLSSSEDLMGLFIAP